MAEKKSTTPEGKKKDASGAEKKPPVSAFDAAAKYLSLSPRSEKEVRERLYKKGYHKAEVEDAIARAKEYGYIDDVRYVADFAEYYGAKLGRKKLEYKLVTEKGIPREIALNGIADAVSEEEEREKAVSVAMKYAAGPRQGGGVPLAARLCAGHDRPRPRCRGGELVLRGLRPLTA